METLCPPHPGIDLPSQLYYELVHTLTGLMPPPIDDMPEALLARNHAAISKVASLLPVNANEADLAAQCIASRAQAEDTLRLLRQHAGDIGLVLRLNAQYGSMVRTSLSVQARLMRVQALRQKRDATAGTANEDAWTLHIAERSMLAVVDPDTAALQTTSPERAWAIQPERAWPIQPERAWPIQPERAWAIQPERERAIQPERAWAIQPEAARPTSPEAAPATDVDETAQENISQEELNLSTRLLRRC